MYHSECYAELLGLNEGLQQAAAAIEGRKREHLRAIARAGSIANRIRVYFGGSGVNVEARENALAELEQEERERSLKAAQTQRQLEDLWDYWTEYPPDWDERKAAARGASGVCEDCGADWQLHVHHRRQISNGGSHRPENLMLLCAECHGFRHGKDFSHRRTYRESRPGAFGHRIQVLRLAIHEARPVRFSYRKYSGEKSTRSLSPRRFKRVGRTLCVEGFCHLRGAVRTFAVRRMRGVRLTDNPQ